jgi:DNA-binding PadR family transcriptional regulator
MNAAEPLTPAVFHVLLSLADGEKHGYAILKDVEEYSDGEVKLSTGTLYAIIKRLLADSLIQECAKRPAAADDDQRRRYYRLTPEGRTVAVAEADRLEKLIERARSKKLIKGLSRA